MREHECVWGSTNVAIPVGTPKRRICRAARTFVTASLVQTGDICEIAGKPPIHAR